MNAHIIISGLALREVPATQRHIIANLMQLCLHDYSGFADIGNTSADVCTDGRFVYRWLDSYWAEAGRVPLLIEANGQIAGFALINQYSVLNRPLDRAITEFFILRRYRRIGAGSRAAQLIFERFAGRWEVAMAKGNQPALVFWRKAIAATIPGGFKEYDVNTELWTGTVLCFHSCCLQKSTAAI